MESVLEMPWLVFTLGEELYALDCSVVCGISVLPNQVQPLPEQPETIRGIAQMRGNMVPLLEMRKIFGKKLFCEEKQEFEDMLDLRKAEHQHWVNELERTAQAGEPFTLATDPHKCAFGRWYDSFISESHSINSYLSRIEEPHRKLHETAMEIQKCNREQVCVDGRLQRLRNEYEPKIISLIEGAKEVFEKNQREMVITIKYQEQEYGLIVDSVLSMENLQLLSDEGPMRTMAPLQWTCGVAQSKGGMTLLLDYRKLLSRGVCQ